VHPPRLRAGQHRGFLANAPDVTVDPHARHRHRQSRSGLAQAIGGFDNTKRFRGRWLYLEATGENFLVGGNDPTGPDNATRKTSRSKTSR
jgi:hypothetical protein